MAYYKFHQGFNIPGPKGRKVYQAGQVAELSAQELRLPVIDAAINAGLIELSSIAKPAKSADNGGQGAKGRKAKQSADNGGQGDRPADGDGHDDSTGTESE